VAEYAGYQATLEVELGAVWTTVAQVRDLSGPALAGDQIEVSHRDSRFRRYVGGMLDGGEVTFEIVFDPDHASHDPTLADSMYSYAESGEVADFRITFPGVGAATTTATFSAFVSNFEINAPLEDGLMADMTLKITGSITWAHDAGV
jgi:hypothetical protein